MDAPLLLWLQGGPGTSSLFGLFSENGPIYVDQDGQGEWQCKEVVNIHLSGILAGTVTMVTLLYCAPSSPVHRRDITWNAKYHLLYIDNPVSHCTNRDSLWPDPQ